jgi:hypothetical protein
MKTESITISSIFGLKKPRRQRVNPVYISKAEKILHVLTIHKLTKLYPDMTSNQRNKTLRELFPVATERLGKGAPGYWFRRVEEAVELGDILEENGLDVIGTNNE